MRTEHIKASTWREAIKLAPWAQSLIPVKDGYMAFADGAQAFEFQTLQAAQRALVHTLDNEREECLEYLATEFGATLTLDQIRFAITVWMERGRRAQVIPVRSLNELVNAAGQEARRTFDLHAPGIAKSMEQHVADGEGRN